MRRLSVNRIGYCPISMMSGSLSVGARASTALAALVGAGSIAIAVAGAAPAGFELVFDGKHQPLASSANGLGHAGPFTSSTPFCSAGTAEDQRVLAGQKVTSVRVYTCDDGSGTATLRMENIPFEHVVGGAGTWEVTGGTGSYAKLRGNGSWKTLAVVGNEESVTSLTFRTRLQGTAAIDETAPSATFSRATAKKLARPKGAYMVTVAFVARDSANEGASYRLKAKVGTRTLASQAGRTALQAEVASLTVRPPSGARTLQLELTATDEVGNARTVMRSLKLPA